MGLASNFRATAAAAKEAASAVRDLGAASAEAGKQMATMTIMATEFVKASEEAKKALLEQAGATKKSDEALDAVLQKNEKLLDYTAAMTEALKAGTMSLGAYMSQMSMAATQIERMAAGAKDGGPELKKMAEAIRQIVREIQMGQR